MSLKIIVAIGAVSLGAFAAPSIGWQPEPAAPAAAHAADRVTPEAKAVLDRMRAHFNTLKGVSVKATTTTSMSIDGDEHKNEWTCSLRAARPNLVSSRVVTGGDTSPQQVTNCDGKTETIYLGVPMNMYETSDAPASLLHVFEAASFGDPDSLETLLMTPDRLVTTLMDEAASARLADDAERVELVGREQLDGKAYDRLRISGADVSADFWVRAEGDAWVDRIVPDMSKALEGMPRFGDDAKERLPKFEIVFADWAPLNDASADSFKFTPPDGAQKVASLQDAIAEQFGGGDDDAGYEDMLGKPAPEFALDLLDSGKMSIEAHRGKQVVVLDFWATWCPPCVRGLPLIAKTCDEFKDKGVVFYAVNQAEPADTIRAFLKKRSLDIKVPLDSGQAAKAYGVTGIPQTVLIGRDGTVQAVHVGFMPGMEDDLREQLQTLVDNKPLVAPGDKDKPEKGVAKKAPLAPDDKMAAEEVWSRNGSWAAAASDSASGEIYAISQRGKATVVGRDGEEIRTLSLKPMPPGISAVRLANLTGDKGPEIVTFRSWGPSVDAYAADGERLWTYKGGDGVDDVCSVDLDANAPDGRDEVIIGYNGGTGLHALNADGKLRWEYRGIGNVWHVTSGFKGPDGSAQVVTTSAGGDVHFFSASGKPLFERRAAGYANLVRLARTAPDADPVIITSIDNGNGLSCMNRAGDKLWSRRIAGDAMYLLDGTAATDRPWFAVAAAEGKVLVFDVTNGDVLATIKVNGSPSAAWLPGAAGKPPMLVVSGPSKLTAYTLVPATEGAAPEPAKAATP